MSVHCLPACCFSNLEVSKIGLKCLICGFFDTSVFPEGGHSPGIPGKVQEFECIDEEVCENVLLPVECVHCVVVLSNV